MPVARVLLEIMAFIIAADLWSRERSRAPGNHLRRGKPLIGKCVVSGFQHEPLNHQTPKGLVGFIFACLNIGLPVFHFTALFFHPSTVANACFRMPRPSGVMSWLHSRLSVLLPQLGPNQNVARSKTNQQYLGPNKRPRRSNKGMCIEGRCTKRRDIDGQEKVAVRASAKASLELQRADVL